MNWLRAAGLRLILSIGLGLALWGYVTYVARPDQTRPFNVPVAVRGLTSSLVIVNADGIPTTLDPVTINVQASQETLAQISPGRVDAWVELSELGPGTHQVPIQSNVDLPPLQRANLTADPGTITVRLELEIEDTVPLRVEPVGNVPASFEQDLPLVTLVGQDQTISEVRVRGPASRVERVASANALVDVTGRSANYTSRVQLEPLSESGQRIEGVEVEPVAVNVTIPIRPLVGIKQVPILTQTEGTPASGYQISQISVQPPLISLTGSSGPLDQVQNVTTQPVNISGISSEVTRTVQLLPPPLGVSFQAGVPESVVVTVSVVPIQQTYSQTLPVPVQAVDIPNGLTLASLSPQIVQVTVSGVNLGALDPQALQGSVSLAGLGPGIHELVPTIVLPQGVQLVGEVDTVTVTLRAPATPTTVPPTAEPTADATTEPTAEVTPEPTAEPTPEPAPEEPTPDADTAAPEPEETLTPTP